MPASSASSPSSSAVSGVSEAGFSTTVQPHARAGAIFHIEFISGKFHGTIAATTPTGTRSMYVSASGRTGTTSPMILSGQPA